MKEWRYKKNIQSNKVAVIDKITHNATNYTKLEEKKTWKCISSVLNITILKRFGLAFTEGVWNQSGNPNKLGGVT